MSNYGMYPQALVEKFGIEKVRKLMRPDAKRIETKESRRRSVQEKVMAYVAKNKKFRVWMCAKCCSEKSTVILPILMLLPDLQVTPDGLCTKIPRRKGANSITKKGDR